MLFFYKINNSIIRSTNKQTVLKVLYVSYSHDKTLLTERKNKKLLWIKLKRLLVNKN